MLKFKKLWLFLLGIVANFWINLMYAELSVGPQGHIYDTPHPTVNNQVVTGNDPIWQWIYDTVSSENNEKIKWILQLPQANNYDTNLWYILAIIQIAINWILGILAFVALVYMLYCWFLVLSSWSDDKNASAWKKWIKTTVIAIAWIGLAWLIISAMIWFINTVTVSSS